MTSRPKVSHPHRPPAVPPVSSKAKDYSGADRPSEITDELDALRTAGIARVLNRHFTDTTRRLAKEKAHADAALADLERRRSSTKKWDAPTADSGSTHLNPYDALYMELQQKRAECRRKERETMLLYQRYVMKYGQSAKSSPPINQRQAETAGAGAVHSDPPPARGRDPPADHPGKSILLGTLPEDSELGQASTTMPSSLTGTRARNDSNNRDQTRSREEATPVKNFMSALNNFMKMDKEQEGDDEQVAAAAEREKQSESPSRSPLRRGNNKNDFQDGDAVAGAFCASTQVDPQFQRALSSFVSKKAMSDVTDEADNDADDNFADRNPKVEDAGSSGNLEPTSVSTSEQENAEVAVVVKSTPIKGRMPTANCDDVLLDDSPNPKDISEIDDGEQDDGKDELDVTTTELEQQIVTKVRTVSIDGSDDENFLTSTTPNHAITNNLTATVVTPTVEVTASGTTTETPPSFAATTIDDEFDLIDERSIISGLTSINSAVTRQVLDDVHNEIEDFIKTETAAIRRMLDTESDGHLSMSGADYDLHSNNSSFPSQLNESSSSLLGDESILVAAKAEAMAREMQRILEDFQKDDASSMGERMSHISEADEDDNKGSAMPSGDIDDVAGGNESGKDATATKYPYKFEPAIPGEEWYVYYDDKYEREFYLEKNTNQSQWEEPSSAPSYGRADRSVVTAEDFMSDMHSVASSRASRRSMSSRRSSRRSLYRKKMKKRRRRRLIMAFFALFSVLVCVFHWRVNYPERSFADAMKTTVINLQNLNIQVTKTYLVDQFEYTFTDRRAREEAEAALAKAREIEEQRRLKALREQKAREAAARKAREETERRAAEAAERERIRKAKEEAAQVARLEGARKASEKTAADAVEAARLAEEEEKRKRELQGAYADHTGAKKEEDSERRPIGCNIPFAYVVHQKCGRLAKSKPLFNPEALGFLE